MTAFTFSTILPWVLVNGYLMIFIAIVIGGPIFISAAAFAAALGHLNVYFVFGLAFFGGMAVNIAFYFIGHIGRASLVKTFGRLFGLTRPRISKLEQLLFEHTWKTMLIIKYSPIIPVPGFVMIGAAKLRFKKFFYALFFLSLPEAVFFTLVGYFFGQAYGSFIKYFYYGQYLIVAVIILFIVINYLLVRLTKRISEKELNFK